MKKPSGLSALNRAETINNLRSSTFDLLIIGGGITGAGIALDAASRGLKTALIEKNDFASGTSSRSTKLIHGGLRYLKQLEFGLVREVGHERAVLHKNAIHLIRPENMLVPIIKGGSLGRLSSSIGLYLYDVLAGVIREERRVMLNKEKALKREPLLRADILKAAGLYKEYRTNDARLVIEVIKTAVHHGAVAINYLAAEDFIYENEKAAGVKVKDARDETPPFSIHAKKIINAAGPWVDELRRKDKSIRKRKLHLTKGVHLVVSHERLPLKQSVYFDTDDKRMIFAIPKGAVTYIGTTDTNYAGDIDRPMTSAADVDYLLTAVNHIFPGVGLKREDIQSSWAGLRPLIHEEGKSPSELSRKDEIFYSPSGVLSIAGGKLTGYRKMAERITDIVMEQLEKEDGIEFQDCKTKDIRLSGSGFDNAAHMKEFVESLTDESIQIGANSLQIKALVHKYGMEARQIIEYAYDLNKEEADSDKRLLLAELQYGIEHEVVLTPEDFLTRRTGKLYFERPGLSAEYPYVINKMADIFHWSETQKKSFLAAFETVYHQAVEFE